MNKKKNFDTLKIRLNSHIKITTKHDYKHKHKDVNEKEGKMFFNYKPSEVEKQKPAILRERVNPVLSLYVHGDVCSETADRGL